MKVYRYQDTLHPGGDEDNPSAYVEVYLQTFDVLRETPKGIWIGYSNFSGWKRFVNLSAKKKYACLSKEDALISFKARKERQVEILEHQLRYAKEALAKAGYRREK